mmetsp:Transcript_15155/g.60897  ORF Transcript_15155/g.60897 Transcript_15155/m.60897 type:complete len:415 (-) Transcript_15155:36-1280(-)
MPRDLDAVPDEEVDGVLVLHDVAIAAARHDVRLRVDAVVRIEPVEAVVVRLGRRLAAIVARRRDDRVEALVGEGVRLGVRRGFRDVRRPRPLGDVVAEPPRVPAEVVFSTVRRDRPRRLDERRDRSIPLHAIARRARRDAVDLRERPHERLGRLSSSFVRVSGPVAQPRDAVAVEAPGDAAPDARVAHQRERLAVGQRERHAGVLGEPLVALESDDLRGLCRRRRRRRSHLRGLRQRRATPRADLDDARRRYVARLLLGRPAEVAREWRLRRRARRRAATREAENFDVAIGRFARLPVPLGLLLGRFGRRRRAAAFLGCVLLRDRLNRFFFGFWARGRRESELAADLGRHVRRELGDDARVDIRGRGRHPGPRGGHVGLQSDTEEPSASESAATSGTLPIAIPGTFFKPTKEGA